MSATVTLTLPVLRNGSGDVATVRRLQEMLNVFVGRAEEGGNAHPIAVDGEFGPRTEQAVRTFQGADGGALGVDGIVGPKTWTKLLTQWLTTSGPA
jgi:peptidoglycan hydrolase-like protein with peptidoglycan-binding domain